MVARILCLTGVLVVAVLAGCAARLEPHAPVGEAGGVRFTVSAPSARSVALSGSFNGWSATRHPMARVGSDGLWAVVIPLPPGEHAFMFVVNGTQWLSPPQAEEYVEDGFGNKNGVVVVRDVHAHR